MVTHLGFLAKPTDYFDGLMLDISKSELLANAAYKTFVGNGQGVFLPGLFVEKYKRDGRLIVNFFEKIGDKYFQITSDQFLRIYMLVVLKTDVTLLKRKDF
jgi:hypothetical protein